MFCQDELFLAKGTAIKVDITVKELGIKMTHLEPLRFVRVCPLAHAHQERRRLEYELIFDIFSL